MNRLKNIITFLKLECLIIVPNIRVRVIDILKSYSILIRIHATLVIGANTKDAQ